MARIRTIKPDLWQDEKLATVSMPARLLFVALISLADDEGRLRGNPLFIRSQAFPYEPKADVQAWLDELGRIGVIVRYQAGAEKFIEVINFTKHQKINRPSESRLPSSSDAGSLIEDSVSPHGSITVGRDQGSRIKDQGSGSGSAHDGSVSEPDPVEAAFACWNHHRHPSFPEAQKLTPDRRKFIRRALELVPLDQWPRAIAAVNAWPWAHGEGQKPPKDWRPSLDWLLAKDGRGTPNILRAAEGQLGATAAPAAEPSQMPKPVDPDLLRLYELGPAGGGYAQEFLRHVEVLREGEHAERIVLCVDQLQADQLDEREWPAKWSKQLGLPLEVRVIVSP